MQKATKLKDRTLQFSMLLNVLQSAAIILLAVALLSVASQPRVVVTGGNVPQNVTQGNTFAGIGEPLNSSELAAINNAPNSYFETAGQKLLNQSLTNFISVNKVPQYPQFIANGKPSVIYIGAISCVYCGENRWAMALALSRFGSFTKLFKGYSSLEDHDIPTLYWSTDNYNAIGATFGNFYNSSSINFISAEYDSPIAQSLQIGTPSYFAARAPNATYKDAMQFMNGTGKFGGTPFTFWGTSLDSGADAAIFGNATPSSSTLPIKSWTHAQILKQFSSFNDQFAWSEYAAADVYDAQICAALSDANTISVCTLPSIIALEGLMNLTALSSNGVA